MTAPMDYAVVIERADDGSYSAYVPDLPGCVACGDTRDEVAISIEQAGAGGPHLETPVRRAVADLRGLPRRADDAEEARPRRFRPLARTGPQMVRAAGPVGVHRPGHGDRQRLVDHDDQPGLRRQR